MLYVHVHVRVHVRVHMQSGYVTSFYARATRQVAWFPPIFSRVLSEAVAMAMSPSCPSCVDVDESVNVMMCLGVACLVG